MKINRRKFLQLSSFCAGSIVISTGLAGCNLAPASLSSAKQFSFKHGVASGDPLQDAVILWTRATPKKTIDSLNVGWEISEQRDFNNPLRSGSTVVNSETDFTLKVDVKGLKPATQYFYRFSGKGFNSEVGTTKTLPEKSVEQVNFIVCSCANFPAGFFNAYDAASKHKNIDAVLHLGDYLYEYGMGQYATEHAEEIGRALPPGKDTEMISLTQYRDRYSLYRSDESLQKLHASAAFILVWDDHEIANDTWRNGAQNHSQDEGDFLTRKLSAIQAWYEWLPVRINSQDNRQKIYRSFHYGDLVSLHMLDTRVVGRDKQLVLKDYKKSSDGSFDANAFDQDLNNETRTLLGKQQFHWLEEALKNSSAKWQLLGQQVLMGKMLFPNEVIKSRKKLDKIPQILKNLSELKQNLSLDKKSVTKKQRDRLDTKFPYNLDGWDGYPKERENIYKVARKYKKNLVVVAGDTHNAWSNDLMDDAGNKIGVEFAVQSISSPGMEKYLKMNSTIAVQTAESLTNVISDLQYCNLHQRGYMLLNITAKEVVAKWIFIDNLLTKDYQKVNSHTQNYQLKS